MATPHYQIAIRARPYLDRCIDMAPGQMKDCVNTLMFQALKAMGTEPAFAALVLQAKRWAKIHAKWTHMASLEKHARRFQDLISPDSLLKSADRGPMVLVDMSMEDGTLGINYSPQIFSDFSFSQARIALNGKRVYLYFQDYLHNRPEQYARWIQLFNTCCHEFAHVFTDFLTTTICAPTRCSTPPLTDRYSTAIESEYDAGNSFESFIFSGRGRRLNDSTGWDWSSMPGIPVVQDSLGYVRGIPLYQVISLAEKTSYADKDFDDIMPDLLDGLSCLPWYDEWFENFRAPFGFMYPHPQIETENLGFSEYMTNQEIDWYRSLVGAQPQCCKTLPLT